MTLCKNCGKGIKWFKDPVNDKWIPLEADCNLEYESREEVDMDEVLQWKHKCTAVLTSFKIIWTNKGEFVVRFEITEH